MATSSYITGRKRYARPQAMLWSDSAGTLDSGVWVPQGVENTDFIILTDHNRGEIQVGQTRIESRQRMVNARMRSYYTADKTTLSTSWNRIPSRAYSIPTNFNTTTGAQIGVGTEYTVDGGAGGSQMLEWYNSHTGAFWVYLSYDRNGDNLNIYNDRRLMFFSSFEHVVEKRGANNFDMWNISVSLEEA